MKIIVCSMNPVKISAAKAAFQTYFSNLEIKPLDLSSNLSVIKQPMSSKETLNAAIKRVEVAQKIETADYYISMEGGIDLDQYGCFLTWYVCIGNNKGKKSIAGGGRMPLPKTIFRELQENKKMELGDIMDRITQEKNIKQKGGSTAIFTGNHIMREDVFVRESIMALIPFTSDIYKKLDY